MFPNAAMLESLVNDLSKEDAVIVVEGKRDTDALTRLGIRRDRIIQAAQRSCRDLEARIAGDYTKLIPLFDNDRSGRKRLALFSAYFSSSRMWIDYSYTRRMRSAGLYCVEDADNVLFHAGR